MISLGRKLAATLVFARLTLLVLEEAERGVVERFAQGLVWVNSGVICVGPACGRVSARTTNKWPPRRRGLDIYGRACLYALDIHISSSGDMGIKGEVARGSHALLATANGDWKSTVAC